MHNHYLLYEFLLGDFPSKGVRLGDINLQCYVVSSLVSFLITPLCLLRVVVAIYFFLSPYRPKDLQEVILVIPSGVSKLMDLLSDSREVVRNDVSVQCVLCTLV